MRCEIRQWVVRGLASALQAMAAALLLFGPALAQQAPELEALAQRWVRDAVEASQGTMNAPLRMEISVGKLDSRLKLAPCGNIEAYLPTASRLWGSTRVGLRCVDGMSRWNVTLPVTVNAYGKAWVIRDQVLSGTPLNAANAVEAEVNWAQEAASVLADPAMWVGQVATRTLHTGQTLRAGMVKPAQAFQAGSSVRVVAQGTGFQISSEAQALSAGVVGQQARVRMENGRVTSGLVLDARTVRIEL
ncbi:MAG: flagellar basal body P-ring formation chaperone FlgA [Rhodoferax sp.]|nr:flagellar basal body P-ring formation chaperone FlgA [Rhodoferax sp.]MCF8208392.1 flagellar basal body P-ring formation chaperone FlgA [Rhodoferax sp.]